VHYVRTWEDFCRLRESLKVGARVVVIGSGFIGAEVASTSLERGCNVTMVEASNRLFPSLPSRAVGNAMAHRYADAGVTVIVGVAVQRISVSVEGPCVHLSDGTQMDADVVVAGIGIELRVELAKMIGAGVGRGVLVDEYFRTSVPGLYAAGDVCTIVDTLGSEVHTEHWKAAQEQGAAAAHSILRLPLPRMALPWCWSDQLGQRIEVAGSPSLSDEQVVRQISDNELCVFHLRQEQLVGIVSMNAMRPMRMAMKLLDRSARPDKAQLADPRVPLNHVVEMA
jgi:3-phenylpropionate/trans-cinnamate dioxygenase ferredoxin reductase subunit